MRDWHQEADTELSKLHEYNGSPCYQVMLKWFIAMYEREKEKIALSEAPEEVQYHWLLAKGLRELLFMVKTEDED